MNSCAHFKRLVPTPYSASNVMLSLYWRNNAQTRYDKNQHHCYQGQRIHCVNAFVRLKSVKRNLRDKPSCYTGCTRRYKSLCLDISRTMALSIYIIITYTLICSYFRAGINISVYRLCFSGNRELGDH